MPLCLCVQFRHILFKRSGDEVNKIFLGADSPVFHFSFFTFHFLPLHKPHRHVHMGASQHREADGDFASSANHDQFALQSGQGAFDDSDLVAGGEGSAAYLHGFGAVVQHEAEAVHLLVGDDGGGALATQHEVAADGVEGERKVTLLRGDVQKKHHGDYDAVYPLEAVAPAVQLGLDGQVALDAHAAKTGGCLLFEARLHVRH